MSDIIDFPSRKPGSYIDVATALRMDLDRPDTRTFVALRWSSDGVTHVYLPDALQLSDLLMAVAVLDSKVRQLLDSQRD